MSKVAKSLPVQVSASNLLKASSSTVSSALPAITKNPSQPQLPPWLLQSQLPPWLPLEPGNHCFLLLGGLSYSRQVHTVIH